MGNAGQKLDGRPGQVAAGHADLIAFPRDLGFQILRNNCVKNDPAFFGDGDQRLGQASGFADEGLEVELKRAVGELGQERGNHVPRQAAGGVGENVQGDRGGRELVNDGLFVALLDHICRAFRRHSHYIVSKGYVTQAIRTAPRLGIGKTAHTI